jgi:malate/lactate dehydrogenase
VTGAAGQIAYSFLPQLCKGAIFPNVGIHLRLLDITPAINVMKGVALELQDCSYPLLRSVRLPLPRSPSATRLKSSSRTPTSSCSSEVSLVSREWKGRISFT